MYFSRQMAQSAVELLLSESDVPRLLSRAAAAVVAIAAVLPPLALNLRVSILSSAWLAILFMELCAKQTTR